MEKLSRALCLCQSRNKEGVIAKEFEESLKNWKLPPFSASDVYMRSGVLFKSYPFKTVTEEIPLSEGYATFPLLSDNLKRACPKKFGFLHIGMIQVGLKPTKLGSNTSAVICLRGEISSSFHESLYGMAESRLSDGPIYFSYIHPRKAHYVSLQKDLCRALSLDVKTEGAENTILMYRLHYRAVTDEGDYAGTKDLSRYAIDKKGETTLFLANVAQSNRVSSKKICWNEVAVPEKWMKWKEYAEAHLLQVGVPAGFRKEEVRVRVETGSIVRITGERGREEEEEVFIHRLRLPENAKLDEVKAVMDNGLLTVVVPKEVINEELEEKAVDIIGF